jgi:hypothetical protein
MQNLQKTYQMKPNNMTVFILGTHKSGSSLVRSLLDGHPALFVVPFETHFFQMGHFWVDYRLRRSRPPVIPFSEAKNEYIKLVAHYNSVTDSLADSNLVGRFDLERFRQEISGEETQEPGEFFLNYMRAIYVSLYGQELPTDLHIVEKSVENAEFALDLKQMFPGAKFIHILRNPYANLVSLRRNFGRTRYPFLGPSLASLNNSYYNLYRNLRLVEDYLLVRYEDLLSNPEQSMRSIADYLGIEFMDNLLVPTSMNRPWKGNSSRGIEFSGVSADNIDLWREEITDLEIHHINRLFTFVLEQYGYEILAPKRSRFLPNRGESLRFYILNRLIPFYF